MPASWRTTGPWATAWRTCCCKRHPTHPWVSFSFSTWQTCWFFLRVANVLLCAPTPLIRGFRVFLYVAKTCCCVWPTRLIRRCGERAGSFSAWRTCCCARPPDSSVVPFLSLARRTCCCTAIPISSVDFVSFSEWQNMLLYAPPDSSVGVFPPCLANVLLCAPTRFVRGFCSFSAWQNVLLSIRGSCSFSAWQNVLLYAPPDLSVDLVLSPRGKTCCFARHPIYPWILFFLRVAKRAALRATRPIRGSCSFSAWQNVLLYAPPHSSVDFCSFFA